MYVEANPIANAHSLLGLDLTQVVMGVASLVLNTLVLVSNYKRKQNRWAIDGILISITAFLDSILGLFLVCGTILRTVNPSIVYDDSPWCIVSFIVDRTITIGSLNLVAILALVRYFVISRNHPERPWLWISLSILVLLILSIFAILRIVTDNLYVFPSRMYCAPIPTPKFNLLVHLTGWLSLMPLVIIPFCYISIMVSYIRRVYVTYGSNFPAGCRPYRRISGMALIILVYYFATVPEYIMLATFKIYHQNPSPLYDAVTSTAYSSISIINAIFPLIFHEEINLAYCTLIGSRPRLSTSIPLYNSDTAFS